MLRALLIDDEPLIVENLSAIIPWQQHQFELVGSAQNGLIALDMVKEYNPDLILCDIRMPKMDGLTFLQKLNELEIESSVIMLTGFAEFEYARKALQFGAKDLLLKPINYNELNKVIAETGNRIREIKEEHTQKEKQFKYMQSMIYEKIITDILFEDTTSHQRPEFSHIDVNWEESSYIFLLADQERFVSHEEHWGEQERHKQMDVRRVLQQALPGHYPDYSVVQTREGEWCILVWCSDLSSEFKMDEALDMARQCIECVAQETGLSIRVGYYPDYVPVGELGQVYKGLQREIQLSHEQIQIVSFSTEFEKEVATLSFWELIEDIIVALKRCDSKKVAQAHTMLVREFKSVSSAKLEKILHFLVLHLLRELKEMKRIDQAEERIVWNCLESPSSVKELITMLNRMINVATKMKVSHKSNQTLMDAAKDYIAKNASSDLSVEEVASYLGLSSSHFCVLFKQHFNETFVEHLTGIRIEWAKSMLLNTGQSISTISKTVGYLDRRYFNKVFAKWVGVTPNEYRLGIEGRIET
ncbi:hypothetical protein AMS62_01235 [Bacillus sp. FJAT-18019]|nr:hypothetical protein AMS62_01235 [Bacillus sp. FJAT-18019]